MQTPLSIVKQRFESKEKLVAAVRGLISDELWLPRLSADRGGRKQLEHVSNSKLLRLHDVLTRAKEEFGSRAKLIDTLLEVSKRAKDAGFRARLEGYPVPRLLDMLGGARKRTRAKKATEAAG
jgi:hypothetical protein